MSDFFDKSPEELLATSSEENRQAKAIIVEKIYEDFETLKRRRDRVYPSPIKPRWRN